jgi:two-component system nitrate/nitrite response regulator NarL
LRYLIEGDPNKTIARKIHITEATVKVHVKAILRKIRVHNRTQAAIWAMNNGSFMPERDNTSSAGARLSHQPPLRLAAQQIASSERDGAAPSAQELNNGGAHNGSGSGDDHVVQSRIDGKYD